ncbi:hypothetical protein [Vibrio europaeus]|uniref:hypothetical protein n=1 Tax=Vibrio europaeus TaxID=300876 RepID=UPI00233EE804|nr:hypothetical protein [Vibrio europaeus]MDC5718298.1 hypothetical protein [Vibrio europaeus]
MIKQLDGGEWVIPFARVEGILVEGYSDSFNASFVYRGKRHTQLYAYGTDSEVVLADANAACDRFDSEIEN